MNNTRCSRYDLIIFTARAEEQFFLKKELNAKPDPMYGAIERAENSIGDMEIGLVLTGMGNLRSAVKVAQVVERVLPKSAVMVGLAAGLPAENEEKTSLGYGDVGVSNQIMYLSYGKITKDSPFPKIRSEDTLSCLDYIDKNWLRGRLNTREWVSLANEWRNESINFPGAEHDWYKTVDGKDVEEYKPQEIPQNPPYASMVNLVSGELVIANSDYLRHVKNQFIAAKVGMYDMESYGVGLTCKAHNVPFFTIKGISDFGGITAGIRGKINEDTIQKATGEDKPDNYRYAAIAGASAVCIDLLKNGFKENVVKYSNPERACGRGKELKPCLHPHINIVCPWKDDPLPRCINTGSSFGNIDSATVAWLCRVFENIIPDWYSTYLQEHINLLASKPGINITAFFPYSASSLLRFIRNDPKIQHCDQREEINKFLDNISKYRESYQSNKNDSTAKKITENIKKLTSMVEGFYGHFGSFNEACITIKKAEEETGKQEIGNRKKQPQIARIIVFENEMPNPKDILDEPLNVIFPMLLGRDVPTYYSSAEVLVGDYRLVSPDVIFVDSENVPKKIKDENLASSEALVALRYFHNARILVITGVPCKNALKNSSEIWQRDPLADLYKHWQEWFKGRRGNLFRKFPTDELVVSSTK